jgi:o-succinylbenzoate synthase
MRIAEVTAYRYDLPLARPLPLKDRTLHTRAGILLRFQTECGVSAYGDAAPLPGFSRESIDDVISQARNLTEALCGEEIPPKPKAPTSDGSSPKSPFEGGGGEAAGGCSGISAIAHLLPDHDLAPSMLFAVQSAVLSLLASAQHVPLSRLLSNTARDRISINALLAGNRAEILMRAQTLAAEGYRTFKLKVGHQSVNEDVETVRQVREVLGDQATIRLDANRTWDEATALAFARGVNGCGIEYIEEPLRDPSGLAAFAAATGLAVALDETLAECGAEALERHGYAKTVVLKPTILGGIEAALSLARKAKGLGMTPVVSSSFESGMGLIALANLAAAINEEDVAAGLDTYEWFAEDVLVEPLPVEGGTLDLARANVLAGRVKPGHLKELSRG